jgi:hypothetical protein
MGSLSQNGAVRPLSDDLDERGGNAKAAATKQALLAYSLPVVELLSLLSPWHNLPSLNPSECPLVAE